MKNKREKKEIKKEGYYEHFTHSEKKSFCQTFLQNGFSFITESAPLVQPQLELPQLQSELYQTHPQFALCSGENCRGRRRGLTESPARPPPSTGGAAAQALAGSPSRVLWGRRASICGGRRLCHGGLHLLCLLAASLFPISVREIWRGKRWWIKKYVAVNTVNYSQSSLSHYTFFQS
jgi:hypothetical protein